MFEEEAVKELKGGGRRERVGERNRGFVVWEIKEEKVEGKELRNGKKLEFKRRESKFG